MEKLSRRKYYSVRNGLHQLGPMSFDVVKDLFAALYEKLLSDGYFQEYFGINCTNGYMCGKLGDDIESAMFLSLRKRNLSPIKENLPKYSENDFFDVIEFLYDHCSKGIVGEYHSFNDCGQHFEIFDKDKGCDYFRNEINLILSDYGPGYELSEDGEILVMGDKGLETLFNAEIPSNDNQNVVKRVDSAINKFRKQRSSLEDRKDAIRELVDVLEFIKPISNQYLNNQDEKDLFNLANNFGIRHHNLKQKSNYDPAIWYSWMFYYYLATIHAVLRLAERKN